MLRPVIRTHTPLLQYLSLVAESLDEGQCRTQLGMQGFSFPYKARSVFVLLFFLLACSLPTACLTSELILETHSANLLMVLKRE